jgi:hypothetical protein
MSKTSFICITIIVSFIVLSFVINDDSGFEMESIPEFQISNQLDEPILDMPLKLDRDPEIQEMEDLLKQDFSGIKGNNKKAWSILVSSYSTKDDVMKDFTLLSNKGFKVYIRDSVIDGKVIYTLNIGPNINEETVKSIKKEVQALLNVSPEVRYYQD